MFGRRGSGDSELVAVAQRRLAALAQQFEHAHESGQDSAASTHELDPPDLDPPLLPGRSGDTGRESLVGGGRHVRPDGSRLSLTPHHLVLVTVGVLAAIVVVAWWVLRSVPDPEPVQLTSERRLPPAASTEPVPGAPPVSTPAGGAPVSSAAPALVVDVAGKVRRPGIVELPAGSRVIDAVEAAGGLRRRLDTRLLNLARPLVDGEQIVVGLEVPTMPAGVPPMSSGGSPTSGLAPVPVDLNRATQAELEALPGIGPVTATAILAWRDEHGAFTSVDELLEVSGIGEATLGDISPFVHV